MGGQWLKRPTSISWPQRRAHRIETFVSFRFGSGSGNWLLRPRDAFRKLRGLLITVRGRLEVRFRSAALHLACRSALGQRRQEGDFWAGPLSQTEVEESVAHMLPVLTNYALQHPAFARDWRRGSLVRGNIGYDDPMPGRCFARIHETICATSLLSV